MRFQHDPDIWLDFPHLAAGVAVVDDVTPDADVSEAVRRSNAVAAARLDEGTEGEFPEIQAWRRTFSAMGLRPTQYRCAAEALLRRFRKEGSLPRIHPLVDLCNALSLRYAVPVAVIDLDQVHGDLRVRRARGTEEYTAFSGEVEHPDPGEVIFADDAEHAHARRWCNRQSRQSAITAATRRALVVAEAQHDGGDTTVSALVAMLASDLGSAGSVSATTSPLSAAAPHLDLPTRFA